MPLASKAQMGKLFALEAEGKLAKGKAAEFVRETPNLKKLPKRVQRKAMGGLIKHLGKMTEHDRLNLLFAMDQDAQAKPVKR